MHLDRRWCLLLLAFIESFSTTLLERGVYFYTHELLAFTEAQNLGLAFAFGVVYVIGALVSHPATGRFGEKRTLLVAIAGILALHVVLAARPDAVWLLAMAFPAVGFLHGVKWPIIESYITAGQPPRLVVRAIGRFNVAWAVAVAPAIAIVGPMNESAWPPMIFAAAAALNVLSLLLVAPLHPRPVHLEEDHPERPPATQLARYRVLLVSVRWSMLASYSLLFLLSPLLPSVLGELGFTGTAATVSASALDAVRLAAFVLLGYVTAWRGRAAPLVVPIIGLPLGFLLAVFGPSLALVLLGEVIFGLAAGVSYYAALYYAIVVKNASVDAGGVHESLIGLGFAIGPLVGLSGHLLADATGGYVVGMLFGVAPLLVGCFIGALRPLPKLARLNAPPRGDASAPA